RLAKLAKLAKLEVRQPELEHELRVLALDAVREVEADKRQHDRLQVDAHADADVVADEAAPQLRADRVRLAEVEPIVGARVEEASEAGIPKRERAERRRAPT